MCMDRLEHIPVLTVWKVRFLFFIHNNFLKTSQINCGFYDASLDFRLAKAFLLLFIFPFVTYYV